MTVVIAVCFSLLTVSAVLCTVRLVRPGSLADRIVALDTLLIVFAVGILVDAARTGRGVYLDALLVVAIVAFISTVAVARFIERRGAR